MIKIRGVEDYVTPKLESEFDLESDSDSGKLEITRSFLRRYNAVIRRQINCWSFERFLTWNCFFIWSNLLSYRFAIFFFIPQINSIAYKPTKTSYLILDKIKAYLTGFTVPPKLNIFFYSKKCSGEWIHNWGNDWVLAEELTANIVGYGCWGVSHMKGMNRCRWGLAIFEINRIKRISIP